MKKVLILTSAFLGQEAEALAFNIPAKDRPLVLEKIRAVVDEQMHVQLRDIEVDWKLQCPRADSDSGLCLIDVHAWMTGGKVAVVKSSDGYSASYICADNN